MKLRHFKHKDYWCDELGNIYCDKVYEKPYGLLHTYNRLVKEQGFWLPKINIDKDGYRKFSPDSESYRVARFVMECYTGVHIPEGMQIDHIDGTKDNDAIENLKICTSKENNGNTHRRKRVSEALRIDLDEYLKTPKTRAHIKRDMIKRGISVDRIVELEEITGFYPRKFMYKII